MDKVDIIMAKTKAPTRLETHMVEKKAMKQVLKLEGEEYVTMMQTLYSELGKDIAQIDKERDELAKSIKQMFNDRMLFIKEAWSDKELTKEEKKQIYDDYMDTSKALHQYLIDKHKAVEKRKARKEALKDISIGTMVVTVGVTAICFAAKSVLKVYEAVKSIK